MLSYIVATLAVFQFMRVCFATRTTETRRMVLSYLLFPAIAGSRSMLTFYGVIVPGTFWDSFFISVMLYNILFFTITLNYKATLAKRMFVAVYTFLLLDTSTAVFSNIVLANIFHFVGSLQPGSLLFFALSFSAGKVVFYCVVLLLRRFKHIKKDVINISAFWWMTMLFGVLMWSVGITNTVTGRETNYFVMLSTSILSAFVIFIVFYLYNTLSRTYEDKLTAAAYAQEKEYYLAQCQIMQESVDKMKAYRHDVKLHLSTLKDFTADNHAATDYLNRLLGDVKESEVYSDTGNLAFDSIINFKLKDIIDGHINLQLKIFVPPTLNMDVVDVVTILGNLLDNAFDAVAKVDDKMINLSVEANKGNLFIKIENTFDGEVKYAEGKAGEEKVISSRKDSGNHGYGLQNIRKSVEKYDGHMDISYDERIFSVGILLYVDAGDVK